MITAHLLILQSLGEVFFQSLYLPGGISGHDDEIISKGGDLAQVQHNDVGSQLIRRYLDDQLRQLCRIQAAAPEIRIQAANSEYKLLPCEGQPNLD